MKITVTARCSSSSEQGQALQRMMYYALSEWRRDHPFIQARLRRENNYTGDGHVDGHDGHDGHKPRRKVS